ncbi:MAG TPA: septum formation family protein [Pseudonocardiaceae bacterium]
MSRPDATPPGQIGTDWRRPTLSTRRIFVGAVLGALAALTTVVMFDGGSPASLLIASGNSAGTPAAQPLRAPVHSCLTWRNQDASDAVLVTCAQPHLFEVTGTVDLKDLGTQATFPDSASWQQLVTSRCTERTTQPLADHFDQFGRFTVGAIKPSQDSWEHGDRTLRCGVQVSGRTGALFATTGAAGQQDQSDVHVAGTCLGNDGKAVGDPVGCSGPHAVEVVGVVDMKNAFPAGYPDEAAQDEVLDAECNRLAGTFAGGPDVVGQKGLTVFWETLRPESWQAGSTRVDCRLGAFLPDRSGFAPVTGTVKGQVRIGKDPAPPAANKPGPAGVTVAPVTDAVVPGPPAPTH